MIDCSVNQVLTNAFLPGCQLPLSQTNATRTFVPRGTVAEGAYAKKQLQWRFHAGTGGGTGPQIVASPPPRNLAGPQIVARPPKIKPYSRHTVVN